MIQYSDLTKLKMEVEFLRAALRVIAKRIVAETESEQNAGEFVQRLRDIAKEALEV